MTATIKTIFSCPRCDNGITSIETTTKCPSCGLPLGKYNDDPYTPPLTFTEQHEKHRDTKLHVKAITELPIEKANSIMNDALSIMELIAGKKENTSGISMLIGMGIKIGEIAKAYDAYLTAGGKHVPSFYTTSTASKPGDKQDEPVSKNASGEQSSTSTENNVSSHMEQMHGSGNPH
jgi:hypothetical protein